MKLETRKLEISNYKVHRKLKPTRSVIPQIINIYIFFFNKNLRIDNTRQSVFALPYTTL